MVIQGPIYTMDHEVGPWKMAFLNGLISLKIQYAKPLGPSLGVKRIWTKGNDRAPKVDVLIFLIYAQKGQL